MGEIKPIVARGLVDNRGFQLDIGLLHEEVQAVAKVSARCTSYQGHDAKFTR
jgi:hypothetical protein